MKKAFVITLIVLLVGISASAVPFDKKGDNSRLVMGRVTDRQDSTLANAVVYLTNTRTREKQTWHVKG